MFDPYVHCGFFVITDAMIRSSKMMMVMRADFFLFLVIGAAIFFMYRNGRQAVKMTVSDMADKKIIHSVRCARRNNKA